MSKKNGLESIFRYVTNARASLRRYENKMTDDTKKILKAIDDLIKKLKPVMEEQKKLTKTVDDAKAVVLDYNKAVDDLAKDANKILRVLLKLDDKDDPENNFRQIGSGISEIELPENHFKL